MADPYTFSFVTFDLRDHLMCRNWKIEKVWEFMCFFFDFYDYRSGILNYSTVFIPCEKRFVEFYCNIWRKLIPFSFKFSNALKEWPIEKRNDFSFGFSFLFLLTWFFFKKIIETKRRKLSPLAPFLFLLILLVLFYDLCCYCMQWSVVWSPAWGSWEPISQYCAWVWQFL